MRTVRIGIALLLLLVACQVPGNAPPLVVVVVVDQLRWDYLDKFDDEFEHGFRRLLDSGRFYDEAYYGHAITATGPGHATVASGAQPAQNGYVGNSWWEFDAKRSFRCSEDSNERLLIGSGQAQSPRRLLRTCVGDWLKQASPRSRVISIADKGRSAVAMGGQRPDWAIWREGTDYDTSSYYGDAAPSWLTEFTASRDIELVNGLPTNDRNLFDLASIVVEAEQLGRDHWPDLLFLGCSVADYVGHGYGPRSPELRAYYLELDRELGEFLLQLDESVGADQYRLLLTADHGVADLPEDTKPEGIDAERIPGDEFAMQLDAIEPPIRSQAGLNEAPFPERSFFGVVYSDELRAKMDDSLRDFVVAQLQTLPSVAAVYARDGSVGDDEYAPLFRNSFHPTRGYDLYFRHRENWLVGIGETGTNHGSCYAYDRHVPILTYGPGIEAGRSHERVEIVQIAPTLARWLEVPAPADLPAHALPQ